jgi:CheY-like chemotaxis protein
MRRNPEQNKIENRSEQVKRCSMEILIVEDQQYPLDALTEAAKAVLEKKRLRTATGSIDTAPCYKAADERIRSKQYDLVMLDHRMPYEDQGDLEMRNLQAYSSKLLEIGYDLIPLIREKSPRAIIIGTSSLEHIRSDAKPDYTMRKEYGAVQEDLERILAQRGQ